MLLVFQIVTSLAMIAVATAYFKKDSPQPKFIILIGVVFGISEVAQKLGYQRLDEVLTSAALLLVCAMLAIRFNHQARASNPNNPGN